jgi:RNA polymerase sigma-70 factor (ECF subfamily)
MDEMDELITAQIPRLRRYARVLTGNSARADDLVQDCLERAWSRQHLWRPGSDLRAWLFTIMHNVHTNNLRQYRRRPALVAFDDQQDSPALTSASTADGTLALRDLAAALAALPPEQRAVLLLVTVEELSYGEVATIVGVPIGTVMSRLHRARERLRAHMAGESEPPTRGMV